MRDETTVCEDSAVKQAASVKTKKVLGLFLYDIMKSVKSQPTEPSVFPVLQ